MTRKSRREIERALDDLGERDDSPTSDVAGGVTAPWVTYHWGQGPDDVDDGAPEFITPDGGGGAA